MLIESIYKSCCLFRTAIEKTEKNLLPITFRNFPIGSCGDVTPLLGAYLKEKGFGTFYYVLGFREGILNGKIRQLSHAWLSKNKLIVDITADQFDEINDKVIVIQKNEWYLTFKSEIKHVAHFNIYDKRTYLRLENAYNEICKNI